MTQLDNEAKVLDYVNYLKTLPLNEDPLIFGLHQNANISYAQNETYECLDTLLALQPKQVGKAAASVEEVAGKLANDILEQLPPLFDLARIQDK